MHTSASLACVCAVAMMTFTFAAALGPAGILERDIQVLTLKRENMADRARTPVQPQMQCKGECAEPLPTAAQCTNKGLDDKNRLNWDCVFSNVPDGRRVEDYRIRCEGAAYSGDPMVRRGSCVVDYGLALAGGTVTQSGTTITGKDTTWPPPPVVPLRPVEPVVVPKHVPPPPIMTLPYIVEAPLPWYWRYIQEITMAVGVLAVILAVLFILAPACFDHGMPPEMRAAAPRASSPPRREAASAAPPLLARLHPVAASAPPDSSSGVSDEPDSESSGVIDEMRPQRTASPMAAPANLRRRSARLHAPAAPTPPVVVVSAPAPTPDPTAAYLRQELAESRRAQYAAEERREQQRFWDRIDQQRHMDRLVEEVKRVPPPAPAPAPIRVVHVPVERPAAPAPPSHTASPGTHSERVFGVSTTSD